MQLYRLISVVLLLVSCMFLTGFKQQDAKIANSNKKHTAEEQKPAQKLDLSVPTNEISFQNPPDVLATAPTVLPGVDINRKKIKQRPVELEGNIILVQEQEAGKTKSADGAGIIVNFHH